MNQTIGRYPRATWIGSPNFGYPRGTRGRQGHSVLAIVYHTAEGTLPGVDSWFNTSSSELSTHFCVGRFGEVHQYVDCNDAAWGNGVIDPTAALPPLWPARTNPNLYTISIEHEGMSGVSPTREQLAASLALTVWLTRQYSLHPSLQTMVRHSMVAPETKPSCPGTAFPLEELVALLARGM